MNQNDVTRFEEMLKQAKRAYKHGNKCQVHYWASMAAQISPSSEDPWLILAAVGSSKASVYYADHALRLNPGSVRAIYALDWAKTRFEKSTGKSVTTTSATVDSPRPANHRGLPPSRLKHTLNGIIVFLSLCAVLMVIMVIPAGWVLAHDLPIGNVYISYSPLTSSSKVLPGEAKMQSPSPEDPGTVTSTPTPEISITITSPPTITSTLVPTTTLTPSYTETPPPEPSSTLLPIDLSIPADVMMPVVDEPAEEPVNEDPQEENINVDEHWIDVDLSKQVLYAYDGDQVVNTFIVSTGVQEHPTVTGQFHIYLKFRFDDMAGPGYYLPDVPYTMYFYKGYGLHGTYWHDNFGTPMSHGCVNLRTEDAAWLFDFASEGTLVNVHY